MEEVLVEIYISMQTSITALCTNEDGDTIGISLTFVVDIYIFARLDIDRLPEKSSVNDKVSEANTYLINQSKRLQDQYNNWSMYIEKCNKDNATNIARNWDDVKSIISPIVIMGSRIRDEIDNLLLDTDNKYRNDYEDLNNTELDNKFLLFEANCLQIEKDLAITFGIDQWNLYQTFNPSKAVANRYNDMKNHVGKSKELDLVLKREEVSDKISALTKKITDIKNDRNGAVFSIPELKNKIKDENNALDRKSSTSPSHYIKEINDIESQFAEALTSKKDMLVNSLNSQIDLLRSDKKAKKFEKVMSWIDETIDKENKFINVFNNSNHMLDTEINNSVDKELDKSNKNVEAAKEEIAKCEAIIVECDKNIAKVKEELENLAHEYSELVKEWPRI